MHPISRALAAVLALTILIAIPVGAYLALRAFWAGSWRTGVLAMMPMAGVRLIRLFWIAARSGEEPTRFEYED